MENKEFTKKDLKNKMVVELKDGDRFIVIDDILLNDCSFDRLSYYNDDFTNNELPGLDIIKVYNPKENRKLIPCNFNEIGEEDLIWERRIDWSKVPVDTKVLVSGSGNGGWLKRYFAKYENGKIYTWDYGATSFSVRIKEDCSSWKHAKLYEE